MDRVDQLNKIEEEKTRLYKEIAALADKYDELFAGFKFATHVCKNPNDFGIKVHCFTRAVSTDSGYITHNFIATDCLKDFIKAIITCKEYYVDSDYDAYIKDNRELVLFTFNNYEQLLAHPDSDKLFKLLESEQEENIKLVEQLLLT